MSWNGNGFHPKRRKPNTRTNGSRRYLQQGGKLNMFYDYEGEEDQHAENCNFIYGNCDCVMSDPDISENDRIRMLIDKYED